MRQAGRIVYFPMEVLVRELDSRLLLAKLAVENDFDVIMGQKWLLERNISAMPPGLYFSKTLTKRDSRALIKAKEHGFVTAALDEEMAGLLLGPEDLWWIAEDAMSHADFVFCSGATNVEALRQRFPLATNNIHEAGNPRWDLLRPEFRHIHMDEVERIRQNFGEFLLVNTNFGFTNSHKGTPEALFNDLVAKGKIDPDNAYDVSFVEDVIRSEYHSRDTIVSLIDALAEHRPDIRIVLRPHPSERVDTWETVKSRHGLVSVVREGSVVPWLLAAKALVHCNCTTGVEAHALDIPALCILSNNERINNRYLSNKVNPTTSNAGGALAWIEQVFAGKPDSVYTSGMREAYASGMSQDPQELGAERIWRTVSSTSPGRAWSNRSSAGWRPRISYKWRIPDKNVRTSLFPELSSDDVAASLRRLSKRGDSSAELFVDRCGDRLVRISRRPMAPGTKLLLEALRLTSRF